jgi:methionyl-tRNA formyltransferase
LTNLPYKIAFFGTPEFSVPILKSLYESEGFEVVTVVSQPDRPSGRNLKLTPSPVKAWALKNGLPVITPETCKTPEFIEAIKKLNLDAVVVVAFGQILNQKLLDIYPHKFINIHASLLPRWRGAAPIQRAVMFGDKKTGVSAQVMVKKLDAGDVIFESVTEIKSDENSVQLHDRLSNLAAEGIIDGLTSYLKGELDPKVQDESLVNYAAKIEKNETWIDWSQSADVVWNHIRGLALGPGGACIYKGKRLKIIKAEPVFANIKGHNLGDVIAIDTDSFMVLCGPTASDASLSGLKVFEVQPESKPIIKVKDFLNGSGLKVNDNLSVPS